MSTTPSPPGFAHYPDPIEGPAARYEPEPGKNPVLRGMSLWMAGEIISRLGYLQRVFWANAGFGTIKDMTVLDEIPYTFQPVVTPLGKTGPMLELGPELRSSQYGDVAGRYLTASDYHALFTAGKTTPLRVAEALLALKRAGGRHSDVWADSHGQDGRALEAARAATQRFAAGRPLGILDGVPVGVKDDVDVAGYINHNGLQHDARVPWFRACKRSAWPVRMLQEAGAVVVGKLRMHELGSDTSGLNVRQGTPSNPVNDAYYPGGSSSGPAAAVAAGLMPICVATDAGGSVRIPASFTGVYGLKTSHHRMGVMNSSMCVTGPMAATVADLTIAYRLMAQPDAECAVQGRFALSLPPAPSARRVMGIYRDWWKLADGRVADVCDSAVDWFARQRGYEVVDIAIPHLAEAQLAHGAICLTEMAETARRRTPDPADWLTLCGPANKILLSVGSQTPAADYLKLNALRTLLMRHLAHLFQKYPGLLIITPTTPLVGWPKTPGDEAYGVSDANLAFRNMMFIFLANMTGTPSLSAPVGYVDPDQGQGRLPIGLMATGEWGSEEQLLSWAAEAEGYLHRTNVGGRRRPDTWVDVADLADPARDVKAR